MNILRNTQNGLKRAAALQIYVCGGHAMNADGSARIAHEFHREPLTARRAIALASVAFEENRRSDAERLVTIAIELHELAFAEACVVDCYRRHD